MFDDQFTPEEQQLIELLQNASPPKLNAGIAEAIRQKMLAEMDKPAPVPIPRPAPILRLIPALAAAAAVGLIFVFVLVNNWQNTEVIPPTQIVGNHTATPSATVEATGTDVLTFTPTGAAFTKTLPTGSVTNIPVIQATATATLVIAVTDTDMPVIVATSTATPVIIASATDEPILPSATPTSVLIIMTPIPTLETVLVLEGVIEQIDANVLTINGLAIEVPPGHPILQVVEAGDQVRVQGGIDESGAIVAAVVDTLLDAPVEDATVGVDGPVETIEENIVSVNGIRIELDEDDPVLATLKVGDFLSVQGNFETRDNLIILVVVQVKRLPDSGAGSPNACWYHDDAMGMGHWHCDGMGMGNGGNPPGEPAMGMGNSDNAMGSNKDSD